MTEESAKGKLTLSGKKTLTLKATSKPSASDGRKVVQVEVRKKRVISPAQSKPTKPVEIDEATAQKLKLLAEAKEHDAIRKQQEEAKEILRQKKQAEREQAALAEKEAEEKAAAASVVEQDQEETTTIKEVKSEKSEKSAPKSDSNQEYRNKKSKDYDDGIK